MAPDFMLALRDFPNQSRMPLGQPAKNEKGPFNAARLKNLERFPDLVADSGRKRSPLILPRDRLDLGRVEVFLYIDCEGIYHEARDCQLCHLVLFEKTYRARVQNRNKCKYEKVRDSL